MKLTFTTSLLLLTAASASSTDGGGLRTRRLSLFSNEASGKKEEKATRWLAKGGKADDDDGEGDDPSKKSNPDSKSGKVEKSGNILGGAKSSKSEFLKTEKARPYSGISTDDDLYYFGETITGAFELNEDILSEDALSNLNVTHIEEFKFALYPYMGRPNCDGNDPIREVEAVFAEGGTEDPIDFEGSFEISTDVAMKEEAGTGYDLFLLDESCNILLGPEAITITLTPEAQEAEDVAAKAKASKANTPRAKAEKDKTAPVKTYKKKKEKIDSEKITVKSKPALSSDDYELSTDKEEYETGETITVSYNIIAAPAAPDGGVPTSESRRILKKKKKKGKKGDDEEEDDEEEEPEIPEDFGVVEELTEDDAASKPQPEVTADEPVEESAEKEKPVPDQPEPETIIQPDPMVSEDEEESDGELQTEMAAPDDLALEEEEESDPSDITKYSLGVFMKMANPQGGKLPPLYEVPLCATDSCSPADISSGEITISVDSLDTSKFGLGYDLWLLDGSGDGMAGPVFFSIDIDA